MFSKYGFKFQFLASHGSCCCFIEVATTGVSESAESDIAEKETTSVKPWPGEAFGQLLLNASTRARKSLHFLVTTNVEKDELLKLVNNVDKHLIVASSLDLGVENEDETLILQNLDGQHAEDIARIGVHRENIDLLYRYFNLKVNIIDSKEVITAFTELVMPGLIGREKSKDFLKELTDFLEYYEIENDLNRFEFGGIQKWYTAAYSRGLLRIIEWRMGCGVPQGIPDDMESLICNVLFSACYHGSAHVIKHALDKGCQFFKNDADVDMRKIMFRQSFIVDEADEQQSLLSLVTMTNKDPQAAKILLGYLQRDHFNDRNIEESLKQSFLWSIEYCAFEMLRSLICGDHESEMWTVFKDTLPISFGRGTFVQFKEKVEKYANLSQDPKWEPELKKIHSFIVELRQKLEG